MSVPTTISQKTIATVLGAALLAGCAQIEGLKGKITGSTGASGTAAVAAPVANAASGATAWVASAAASAASAAREMAKGDKEKLSPAAEICKKNNVTIKVLESSDSAAKMGDYSTEINGPKGERVQVSFKTRAALPTSQGSPTDLRSRLNNAKQKVVNAIAPKTVTPTGLAACMQAVTGKVTPKVCAPSLVVFNGLASGGTTLPAGYTHAADIKGKDGRLVSIYTPSGAKKADACTKAINTGIQSVAPLALAN